MSGPIRPVQQRSVATIERALDAATRLLATDVGLRLRLSDVTALSGVSNGSLVHHFGSREGLIAAAQTVRHARALDERLAQSRSLGTGDAHLVAGIRDLASKATTSEHDEQRRARFQALAFARHVPELREVLVASHRGYADSLAQLVEAGQQRGLVRADVAPRAVAAFALTSASGRLVDDLLGDARPAQEWQQLLTVLVGGIVASEVMARGAGPAAPPASEGRSAASSGPEVALRSEQRPTIPAFAVEDEDEERFLTLAAAHRDRSGSDGLRLGEVLTDAGVSRAWFSHRFIDRDTLLDLVFLRGLVSVAHVETAAFEAAFDAATSAEDLLRRLGALTARSSSDASQQVAWDRLELLLVAAARPGLRVDAASIVSASTGRIAAAIGGAQQRGLVRSDVAAAAVARYYWATPLMHLVATLSDVAVDELAQLSVLTSATLVTARAKPSRRPAGSRPG
jgi:AcrR family transcriptional regulator